MSVEERPAVAPWWQRISEDWWSVIIGIVFIGLVLLRVIAGVPW